MTSTQGSLISRYFSPVDLQKIKEAVRSAEFNTSGEIRVEIIEQCDPDLRGNLEAQALREFEREGMHNTRDKTGVLVLLVLGERRFRVLADKGIYEKLGSSYLNERAQRLSQYFRAGEFTKGLCEIVADLGEVLVQYFPRRPDDINELPDEVIRGGQDEE